MDQLKRLNYPITNNQSTRYSNLLLSLFGMREVYYFLLLKTGKDLNFQKSLVQDMTKIKMGNLVSNRSKRNYLRQIRRNYSKEMAQIMDQTWKFPLEALAPYEVLAKLPVTIPSSKDVLTRLLRLTYQSNNLEAFQLIVEQSEPDNLPSIILIETCRFKYYSEFKILLNSIPLITVSHMIDELYSIAHEHRDITLVKTLSETNISPNNISFYLNQSIKEDRLELVQVYSSLGGIPDLTLLVSYQVYKYLTSLGWNLKNPPTEEIVFREDLVLLDSLPKVWQRAIEIACLNDIQKVIEHLTRKAPYHCSFIYWSSIHHETISLLETMDDLSPEYLDHGLVIACRHDKAKVAEYLIQKGANLSFQRSLAIRTALLNRRVNTFHLIMEKFSDKVVLEDLV